ncbi:MAG: 50S ribosomal protein L30 [Polyangiaceae bacterium]
MKSHLSVKLVRSTIGTSVQTRKVVDGLGLRKIGHSVTVANTPSFRGMVKKVLHLVEVEEVSAPASTTTPAKS